MDSTHDHPAPEQNAGPMDGNPRSESDRAQGNGRRTSDRVEPSGPSQKDETAPDHAEMPAALGYVSHANRTCDTIDTGERVRDLRQRIKQLNEDCDQLQLQITSKERERNAIEEHGRGWPLIAVVLLGLVTIGLEYFPATQFTQIFEASDTQRSIFTAIFTVVPAVLALALGELLRRCRVPTRQRTMDTILLAGVAVLTVAFLAIGFWLRLAYTSASATSAIGLTPWMEALALTSIATIGVALTVVSANYREGIPMFLVSRDLKRLRAELAELEYHLKTDQRDLERAEAAYRGEPVPPYSKWSQRKPTAPPGGPGANGTTGASRSPGAQQDSKGNWGEEFTSDRARAGGTEERRARNAAGPAANAAAGGTSSTPEADQGAGT